MSVDMAVPSLCFHYTRAGVHANIAHNERPPGILSLGGLTHLQTPTRTPIGANLRKGTGHRDVLNEGPDPSELLRSRAW